MCPPDQTSEKPDDGACTGTAGGNADAAPKKNQVVGPLTDDELQAGGMDRVVAFIRTKRSKDALRKEKHRKQQEGKGKRQINLAVPNNDRSRATMRGAAIAIEDEVSHQAIELLLANERLRPLVVGVAARPELHETIDLIRRRQTTTNSLNAARLVIDDPDLRGRLRLFGCGRPWKWRPPTRSLYSLGATPPLNVASAPGWRGSCFAFAGLGATRATHIAPRSNQEVHATANPESSA